MGLRDLFKRKTVRERIIDTFYSDYPEIPYIADDREAEWIERASLFEQSLVKRSMMQRYTDGLLPGHVYMLYWLGKYTNKRVPAYFEYKYGIDFEKEKQFLFDNGFLDSANKPTEKGKRAIEEHHDVIESHSAPKNENRNVEKITVEDTEEYEAWLDFIANGGTTKEWNKLKK